jgi:hypothetical protein
LERLAKEDDDMMIFGSAVKVDGRDGRMFGAWWKYKLLKP